MGLLTEASHVCVPVIWTHDGEEMHTLHLNFSGHKTRRPGDDGVIRIGAVYRMPDQSFTVWTQCSHMMREEPSSFSSLLEAKNALLSLMEGRGE